jgi:hypothetical protein
VARGLVPADAPLAEVVVDDVDPNTLGGEVQDVLVEPRGLAQGRQRQVVNQNQTFRHEVTFALARIERDRRRRWNARS